MNVDYGGSYPEKESCWVMVFQVRVFGFITIFVTEQNGAIMMSSTDVKADYLLVDLPRTVVVALILF